MLGNAGAYAVQTIETTTKISDVLIVVVGQDDAHLVTAELGVGREGVTDGNNLRSLGVCKMRDSDAKMMRHRG